MTTKSTNTSTGKSNTIPMCRECNYSSHSLLQHIPQAHNMTVQEYLAKHPKAPTITKELLKVSQKCKKRVQPVVEKELHINIGDLDFVYNIDVPLDVCAPMPKAYRLAKKGQAEKATKRALLGLLDGSKQLIWGVSGIGKDAFFMYWSYMTRTPFFMMQIHPETEVAKSLFSHEIDINRGTYYKEGELLKALRDGYTTPSGRVVPYIIVFTDLDRCTPQQAEHLRLVLDSENNRIQAPDGTMVSILPGTRIVATANSIGSGSMGSKYASVQLIDASILSRFDYKWQFVPLDWADEQIIVEEKFPLLKETFANSSILGKSFFEHVGMIMQLIRKEIAQNDMQMECGHREVCAVLKYATTLCEIAAKTKKDMRKDILREAFQVLLQGVDSEIRNGLTLLIEPHVKGGLVTDNNTINITTKRPPTISIEEALEAQRKNVADGTRQQ